MYEHKVLSISKLQSGLSCQETKLKIIVINKKFKSTKIRGALVNKVSSMASKLTEKLKVRKSVQGNYVAESQKLYCTAPNMRVNNSVLESGSRTNFDNEIPRSGSEWNEYLKGKYGADNVHWNINFVDDIFSDPTCLKDILLMNCLMHIGMPIKDLMILRLMLSRQMEIIHQAQMLHHMKPLI